MPSSERLLISAILQSGDNSFVKQEGLTPKDFIAHKAEFDYISQNGVPSKVMFKKQFPDFSILKSESKDIPQLVTLVRKERIKHEFHRAIEKVLNQVDTAQPMDLAKKLYDSMGRITSMYVTAKDVDVLGDTEFVENDYKKRIKMRKEGRQVGIPTGIPTIDEITGGLAPGELWVIVARQGQMKTWLSLEFAASATIYNVPVLFISLEMPPELIAYRYHTLMWALRHPKRKQNKFANLALLRGEPSLKLYRKFLENVKSTYKTKFIIPDLNSNFNFTTATVAQKIEEHHPGLVVVDYIGLMQSDSTGRIDNWQELAQQVRELKKMALQYKIPIVVNAQANRSSADGKEAPKLHQISNSDAIGATADRVMSLKKMPSGMLRISIEKNRNGRDNFYFDVKWDINNGFLKEVKNVDLETDSE